MSFVLFMMMYAKKWNISMKVLAEELGIQYNRLLTWLYYGTIPTVWEQSKLKECFGDEFVDIKFDRKRYKRATFLTSLDGTIEKFDSDVQAYTQKNISITTFNKYKHSNQPIPKGKDGEGYLISHAFMEVE